MSSTIWRQFWFGLKRLTLARTQTQTNDFIPLVVASVPRGKNQQGVLPLLEIYLRALWKFFLGQWSFLFRMIKSADPFYGCSGDRQKLDPSIGPISGALDP